MTDDQRRQQDPVLWTIGHSTRSSEDFLALLQAHGVRQLLDVRVIPFSRRNPQFNSNRLEHQLQQAGVIYCRRGVFCRYLRIDHFTVRHLRKWREGVGVGFRGAQDVTHAPAPAEHGVGNE